MAVIMKTEIDGLEIFPLKKIEDPKGSVLHMLRNDSSFFEKFGEVYFSYVEPNYIKAWKRHKKQTQQFAVPLGNIQLVVYDAREDSATYQKLASIIFGIDNYCLVKIPPLVWYGFQTIANKQALIANCTDIPHDPQEAEKIDFDSSLIPFSWSDNKL